MCFVVIRNARLDPATLKFGGTHQPYCTNTVITVNEYSPAAPAAPVSIHATTATSCTQPNANTLYRTEMLLSGTEL